MIRWQFLFLIVVLSALVICSVQSPSFSQAASSDKLDLVVYPNVWTVTARNSGANMIAVRGKNGFSGPVTVTVSGLPSSLVDHYPSAEESSQGKGGYYCTYHCQANSDAGFPMTLHADNGQWTSVGPTIQLGSASTTETKTVTITASGGGSSVSQQFSLHVINDSFSQPEGGGPPQQADTAHPDASLIVNLAEFGATNYQINLTPGQTKTANVDVSNNEPDSVTFDLRSNLSSTGLADLTSGITGGFGQSSLTLAGGEQRTLPFTITTQTTVLNGTYEFVMGLSQTDSSNRATIGISTIVTGGVSGATPTITTTASTTDSTLAPPSSSEIISPTTSQSLTDSPILALTSLTSISPMTSSSVSQPATNSSRIDQELIRPSMLAQTVTQQVFEPTALVGVVTAATSFVTGIVPFSSVGAGVGFATSLSTYLLILWNALLEGVGLRRRRYPWGTVFDVQTDQPVELAIVRLKTATGQLVETRVTDRMGRFGFLAYPGSYVIETIKQGYLTVPASQAMGSRFQPVARAGVFTIRDKDTVIATNLPVARVHEAKRSLRLAGWLGSLYRPALLVTAPLGLWNLVTRPSALNGMVFLGVILVLASEWLILHPRFFGVVSGPTNQVLPGIVLQLIRNDDRKVVATQITNPLGRYSFLVRPGSYQMRIASSVWHEPAWLEREVFQISDPAGGIIDHWIRLRTIETEQL